MNYLNRIKTLFKRDKKKEKPVFEQYTEKQMEAARKIKTEREIKEENKRQVIEWLEQLKKEHKIVDYKFVGDDYIVIPKSSADTINLKLKVTRTGAEII